MAYAVFNKTETSDAVLHVSMPYQIYYFDVNFFICFTSKFCFFSIFASNFKLYINCNLYIYIYIIYIIYIYIYIIYIIYIYIYIYTPNIVEDTCECMWHVTENTRKFITYLWTISFWKKIYKCVLRKRLQFWQKIIFSGNLFSLDLKKFKWGTYAIITQLNNMLERENIFILKGVENFVYIF